MRRKFCITLCVTFRTVLYIRTIIAVNEKEITFTTVEGDVAHNLDKMYGMETSFIKVRPSNCLLPPRYILYARKIRDMEIHEDDIWLVSYPRTGSHWTQEMVYCIANDFDYEMAKIHVLKRNPLLEGSVLLVTGNYAEWFIKCGDSYENIVQKPRPRHIKTHLPMDLLPQQIHQKKPKIVYVARNPKDTCVSFYYYCKMFHNMKGSFEQFAELVLTDNAPMGSFWRHVLQFWQIRDQENVLFLTYEEMKRDQAAAIRKTAKFFKKTVTDEQVAELCEYLKFSKMKTNPALDLKYMLEEVNPNHNGPEVEFLRKGKIGDWKNHMSDELARRFDEWTEKNLKGTGLTFDTTCSETDKA